MNTERWHRVDSLLAAALERTPAEREAFLAVACDGDPGLRREVDALIAAAEAADSFLETPAQLPRGLLDRRDLDGGAGAEGPCTLSGELIGAYRIGHEIGRGGMGCVYLAERADGTFEQTVAIKVMQPGVTSPALLRRFRAERQILARLDHPNIARLLDGGATREGQPYLVMEHIEGRPIDDYCAAGELSIRQRLELFREVCAAVHYAHQNLVVHRDLKPSNIVVTADGRPRLLDFGIAKLLDPDGLPFAVEATVTGQRPMTPLYASPEQLRGGAVTTASDVYSLGVLLYKLLTGRLPHRLAGLSRAEAERVLREEEPRRPSTALAAEEAGAAADPDPPGARHRSRRRQLRRRLAGDLDNIVLMALRKDAARRYGSVEQLSEDVRRHLVGLPVLARQESVGYRIGKFLRRYRVAVAITGLILGLVTAFAVVMAQQAAKTSRQRDLAELERDKAEQVAAFLVDLFAETDPYVAQGREITAREVLDRGAEKIERELEDQPLVRASLLNAMSTVYRHLGHPERAAAMAEEAVGIRERSLGGEHPEVADSLLLHAEALKERGDYATAEALYERALAIRERAFGAEHPQVAQVLLQMATLHRRQASFDLAEQRGERALAIYRAALGPAAGEVAEALTALAGVRHRQGRIAESEALLEEALAIQVELHGDLHPATAATLNNLGSTHLGRGNLDGAEALLVRALAAHEGIFGTDHPRVAATLIPLGTLERSQGDLPRAAQRHERALAIYEGTLGSDHPLVATAAQHLAHDLAAAGRHQDALARFEQALEVREKALGGDHPWVAESLVRVAEQRAVLERTAAAERAYRRALPIWQAQPNSYGTQAFVESYAGFLRAQGRPAEAERLEARAAAASPPKS